MTFIQHPPHQAQVINFPRRPQQAPRRQAPRRANRFDRAKLGYIHWQRCEIYYDDEASRIMLTALLHCGLSRKHALDRAPWLTRAELDAMQRLARKLAFDDLGPFIGLTKAEWKLYKAWRFRPLGVSWEEIEEERRKKRGDSNRDRKRNERDERRRWTITDWRNDAVMRMLKDGPLPLPKLIKRARHSPAFPPTISSKSIVPLEEKRAAAEVLRTVVRRVVKRLERFGMVEIEMRQGVYGPVMWVRRVDFNGKTRHAKRTKSVPAKPDHLPVPARIRGKRTGTNGLTPISHMRSRGRFAGREDASCYHVPSSAVDGREQCEGRQCKSLSRYGSRRERWLSKKGLRDEPASPPVSNVVHLEAVSLVIGHGIISAPRLRSVRSSGLCGSK